LIIERLVSDVLGFRPVQFLVIVRKLLKRFHSIGGDQTGLVSAENAWSLELSVKRSVSYYFFHHQLLG
jgi:hypothetical protein